MSFLLVPVAAVILSCGLCTLAAHAAVAAAGAPAEGFAPREIKFNDGWRFQRIDNPPAGAPADDNAPASVKDDRWEAVVLPHTPRVEKLIANDMWRGVCWYRKTLALNPAWKGRKVSVRFDGAMTVADVWVNGKHLTTHYGGYLPFDVDLTDSLHDGDNLIAVRLDNRDNADIPPGKPLNKLDFCWFGGLYRNAWLIVTDPLHITDPIAANKPGSGGVFVTCAEATDKAATIEMKLHAFNGRAAAQAVDVKFELLDVEGKSVAELVLGSKNIDAGGDLNVNPRLAFPNPKLWSIDRPYLYTLRSSLMTGATVVDSVTTRVGIRRISFSRAGGFQINGVRTYLRGTNRHQEYAYLGYAVSDDAQYRDALKIKEAGFDYVRLSHYPQSPAFLDACDELGIVVMNCIPGWQFVGNDLFQQRSIQTARDLIRRDRNHPSVVLWETSLNETGMSRPFMAALQAAAHEEYPDDQCFTAGWKDAFDVYSESRQGGNTRKYKNGDKASIIAEYGDWEYHAGNPGLNQTEFKDLKGKDSSSRQSRGDGELRLLVQAANFQEAANENRSTPAVGDGLWVMYDYSRGYAKDLEESGPMDSLRLPKFSYYFFQSQRDASAAPVAGAKFGPMIFMATYWTKESPTAVRVFSNCEEVELSLDGRAIARQKPDQDANSKNLPHPPFTFKIGAFSPGALKAVGYIDGKPRAEHRVSTPGPAKALRLRVDESGRPLRAGGGDVVFVYADIVDGDGNIVPNDTSAVTFAVKGPGSIAGPAQVAAEAGIAGTLLRGGERVGPIEITASAGKLLSATVTLVPVGN